MKTKQFNQLIQAVTGRPLTVETDFDEIPLDYHVVIHRPYGARGWDTLEAFTWKTPKKIDSLLRSFITAFCSRYLEPDPDSYDCYAGRTWENTYAEKWNDPATRWNCAPWHHHRSHMKSRETLKSEVIENFGKFDSCMGRLGFYPTHYGIGLFTAFGGSWVETSLASMREHLERNGIPYGNELSEAGWVTRFLIGQEKPSHIAILGSF